MVGRGLTFAEMENRSRELNSSASRPLTPDGYPLLTPDENHLQLTANQAHAIDTADGLFYAHNQVPRDPIQLPLPERFQSMLLPQERRTAQPPTPAETVAKLQDLYRMAASLIKQDLFTPYVGSEGQINISQQVQVLATQIYAGLERTLEDPAANGEITILPNPQRTEVINSVTRGFLFPLATPVNTQVGDFDSGNCNVNLNTAFRRGDRGYIGATSGAFAFYISDTGNYGWVDQQHLAETTNQEQTADEQLRYYVGSEPFFFPGLNSQPEVLLPGDTIYQVDDQLCVAARTASGAFYYQPVPSLPPEAVSYRLRLYRQSDFEKIITFLTNLKVPYMWSVFDCSEVIRRAFEMGGVHLPKYSGDIMSELGTQTPLQLTITSPSEFEEMYDGIYIMNLLNPSLPAERQSTHLFLVVKVGDQLKAFSYAFDVIGDQEIEQPIGPHVCGIEALTKQLEKGRQLRVTPLAIA